jgi:type II secretory pathway pseudopilin PulG
MSARPGPKAGGFTLFEFALAAAIVAVLVAGLTERVLFYREQAESVAAEQLIGVLRSALQMQMSQLIVAHKEDSADRIIDENPMDWLSDTPKNYLGEYYSPNINEMPRGNWYYDRSEKVLVYLLNNGKSFAPGPPNLLKFKVKSQRLPSSQADPNGSPAAIQGFVLDQVIDAGTVSKK